jgi:hypothetical protein
MRWWYALAMGIFARQIEPVRTAYRHRSTRMAADALFVSKPAISRAFQRGNSMRCSNFRFRHYQTLMK